ncbi:amidohydrolase family protein [Piscinibacter sp.]|uniref:amidohydrolase family protein n=1 Tax=Piscinibacter sp. TaxID=1903157 RepID=UPI002CAFB0D1|nr:amidohydrolase family protein [Albitalea sp.]HUG23485.1 amidohydrolase family protein [Albitalea sp.]
MPIETSFVNTTPRLQGHVTDCHFHVFPQGIAPVAAARYAPGYGAPLEQWRRGAQSHGVTRGVLVQPSFLGSDNSFLLEMLRTAAGRLLGVAVVAPDIERAELEAMHGLGVRGVRLNLVGTRHRILAASQKLFAHIQSLYWHVELHTEPGRLLSVLQQLPSDLTLVLDHFGRPADSGELDLIVRGRQDRLFVKLSAPYRLHGLTPQALARRWSGLLGPDKLLWGSDWPCTAHEDRQQAAQDPAVLHDWLGDPNLASAVLGRNPDLLYGFPCAEEEGVRVLSR